MIDRFQSIQISVKRDGSPSTTPTRVNRGEPYHDGDTALPHKRVCRDYIRNSGRIEERNVDKTDAELEEEMKIRKQEQVRRKWNASATHPLGKLRTNFDTARSICVIVGHSFVSHLYDSLLEYYNTHDWAYALNLATENISVYLYGIRGGDVNDMAELYNFVEDVKARIFILEIGTNDLTGIRSVTSICNQITRQCCSWLRDSPAIDSIAWCHITPRNRGVRRKVSAEKVKRFNTRAIAMNRIMCERVSQHERLHHWRHRGLSRATVYEFEDGVHPTTEDVQWKYQKSVSRLIRWSKSNLPACDSDVE